MVTDKATSWVRTLHDTSSPKLRRRRHLPTGACREVLGIKAAVVAFFVPCFQIFPESWRSSEAAAEGRRAGL